MTINQNRQNESGSVIFWIFLGVALFVALNFAFMDMNRTGNPNEKSEVDNLNATDIMQYAAAVQRGIRVMKIEGTNEEDICFHTVQWGHNDYEFTPACDDNSNLVFNSEGGAVNFQEPMANWFAGISPPATVVDEGQWVFSARYEIENVGTEGGTSDSEANNVDILLALAPLKGNICQSINELLNHGPSIPGVASGTHDDLANNKFDGNFNAGSDKINDLGRERCVADAEGFNFYYKVILAR